MSAATGTERGPTAARPSDATVTIVVRRRPEVPDAADLAVLTADERDRVAGYARVEDAAAFACGRATLRRILARSLGVRPEVVPLVAPPGRAPRVTGTDLGCSVAHGGDAVLVAVADSARVGVDVEPIDARLQPDELAAIARDLLGLPAAEVHAIRAADPSRAVARFLRLWTLTEAVAKALGTGLSLEPGAIRIEIDRGGGGHARLVGAPGVPSGEAGAWTLRTHIIDVPGSDVPHIAAVAIDRPEPVVTLSWGA